MYLGSGRIRALGTIRDDNELRYRRRKYPQWLNENLGIIGKYSKPFAFDKPLEPMNIVIRGWKYIINHSVKIRLERFVFYTSF